jgi:hypothetical protein
MDHSMTVFLVSGFCTVLIAAGLNFVRREFSKQRRDYRMGQALRRGLLQADGIQTRGVRVVQWQSCETTSIRCS